jgi:TonB-dependent receptor
VFAQVRQFDVPSEVAEKSIPEFARQAGIQVLAPGDQLYGIVTPVVRGSYDVFDALDLMLRGTDLKVSRSPEGIIMISLRNKKTEQERNDMLKGSYTATSVLALVTAFLGLSPASAQDNTATMETVVVSGIRHSLETAAEVKRESTQVVDSIVAEDIGKFPDPTTAGALQRIPGVQVTVGSNNEINGVLVRGLADITTTVDGREIFSGVGRGFAFQDLPAAALSRANVIKTSTADLIEGGIASTIDLQLNKPFQFNEPTMVATARANYENNAQKVNPQASLLLTNTWDTSIGKIGVLVNGSYAYYDFLRPVTFNGLRRTLDVAPFNVHGVIAPLNYGMSSTLGWYRRPEVNASVQWQATPKLQVYVDALYTGYESDNQASFQATPYYSTGATVSNVVTNPDQCFTARVASNGYNPSLAQITSGAFTVQSLCNLVSATFTNIPLNSSTQQYHQTYYNDLIALGMKYEGDKLNVLFDFAYQSSVGRYEQFIVDVGKRISQNLQTNVNGGGVAENIGNPGGDPNGWYFWHGLNQVFRKPSGEMYQARVDGTYDLDHAFGFLENVKFGGRIVDRAALYREGVLLKSAPGGDLVTPVKGNVPDGFMATVPGVSRINGGASVVGPDAAYLGSDEGRDVLRTLYGVAKGDPAYQPERQFDASERGYSGYLQLGYDVSFTNTIVADGQVGFRVVHTQRSIAGAGLVSNVAIPVNSDTQDTKFLPNASIRLQLADGLQARANFSRTMSRPAFDSLNPGMSYVLSTNPQVINSGSAGNPELRPQVSDAYDATLEYYFPQGFVAGAVFYRSIKDRVVSQAQNEDIDGFTYSISRPRNLGEATLKGVEISGQMFFDFLPGALAGLGTFGNFTYVDSQIGGRDPLVGHPLLGVSKYNANVGLLYDLGRFSGRLVYTYRSSYNDGDSTGSNTLRASDPAMANDRTTQVVSFTAVRPNGRLDLGLSYDISDALRIDLGATNLTHNKFRSYYNVEWLPVDYRDDGSTYTIGVRAKL